MPKQLRRVNLERTSRVSVTNAPPRLSLSSGHVFSSVQFNYQQPSFESDRRRWLQNRVRIFFSAVLLRVVDVLIAPLKGTPN